LPRAIDCNSDQSGKSVLLPREKGWDEGDTLQGDDDRNYVDHFAFIDYLLGPAVNAKRNWPEQYGALGDYVPNGFVKQASYLPSATAHRHRQARNKSQPIPAVVCIAIKP